MFGIVRRYNSLSYPTQYVIMFVGFVVGSVGLRGTYNHYSGLIMNRYRDKSALYGRELKPGERPSWPRWP